MRFWFHCDNSDSDVVRVVDIARAGLTVTLPQPLSGIP